MYSCTSVKANIANNSVLFSIRIKKDSEKLLKRPSPALNVFGNTTKITDYNFDLLQYNHSLYSPTPYIFLYKNKNKNLFLLVICFFFHTTFFFTNRVKYFSPVSSLYLIEFLHICIIIRTILLKLRSFFLTTREREREAIYFENPEPTRIAICHINARPL